MTSSSGKKRIVHLKDSRRIGGLYSTNSFASSNPAQPEIYIEQVWALQEDGTFIEPVNLTEGFLVLGDEIVGIEFFRYNQSQDIQHAEEQ